MVARVVVLLAFFVAPAVAQQEADRVLIQRKNSLRPIPVTGRVLDYIGGKLRIRTLGVGNVRDFDQDQIVEIRTPQTLKHISGAAHFEAGRYDKAVPDLETAITEETRDWVSRDMLALLVRCHLKTGNRIAAARSFIRLTDSDPTSHHFHLIPLLWSDEEPVTEAQVRIARQWFGDIGRPAQLIGASLLLSHPAHGKDAVERLKQLAKSGRPLIVGYARTQEWRVRLREKKAISSVEVSLWRTRLKTLGSDGRGGPYYLLGKAHAAREEPDRAALSFLWLPLVHSNDHHLAARAHFAAGESLEKAGRLASAESVYREAAERFADTPFGQRAARKVQAKVTR